jgi:hypothetical protein
VVLAVQPAGSRVPAAASLRLPGRQIQYFTGSPASYWSIFYFEDSHLAGGQFGAWRLLHAGEHLTEDWNRNRYPLQHNHPSAAQKG